MASGRLIVPIAEPILYSTGLVAPGTTMQVNISGAGAANLFADAGLSTPISNPQISNAAGRFETQSTSWWVDSSQSYDVILTLTDGESITFTNQYVLGAATNVSGFAPINSPTFTGNPTAPTPGLSDSSASLATTAYVKGQNYAALNSPAFSGTPTAPTAASGTNSTQLATTAFVEAALPTAAIRAGLTAAHSHNDGTQTTTFATPFLNSVTSVVMIPYNSGGSFSFMALAPNVVSISTTGFSWCVQTYFASSNGTSVPFYYIAVGS